MNKSRILDVLTVFRDDVLFGSYNFSTESSLFVETHALRKLLISNTSGTEDKRRSLHDGSER